MRLTKAGFGEYRLESELTESAVVRPKYARELLRFWHEPLGGIDDDYTFGDLIALLREVEGIDVLSPLLGCDVAAFLEDAQRPRAPDTGEPTLQFVRVHNVAELDRYEPDLGAPPERLAWFTDDEAAEQDRIDAGIAALTSEPAPMRVVDATSDDPITGEPALKRLRLPAPRGSWHPPYAVRREFDAWGLPSEPQHGPVARTPGAEPAGYEGPYALDFTPLSALLHLPLRYDPTVEFWSRPYGSGELCFTTALTITFGELLHAIFREVGFHGAPADRDEAREAVLARAARIERLTGRHNA